MQARDNLTQWFDPLSIGQGRIIQDHTNSKATS